MAETIGQRIQRLRQEAGMSQSELARESKVPIGTLRNWEQDRRIPALDAAARLAKVLGVSLDEMALPTQEPATTEPAGPDRPKKGKAPDQPEAKEEPKK